MTPDQLDLICGHDRHPERKAALCRMVNTVSPGIHDLRQPHELALFLAQVLHESDRLAHVREIWGPTAAQERYEGRADLGNVLPGDGKRFMGRDIIQITGRANYRDLTRWIRQMRPGSPDFEAHPDQLERPAYLGWGALWYWATRIPARYVDEGDMEMITRRVNGGLNGYRDRLGLYTRAALVLLDHGPGDVRAFQKQRGLVADGIAGPRTRAELHDSLFDRRSIAPPPPPDMIPPERDGGLTPEKPVKRVTRPFWAAVAAFFNGGTP